MANVLGYLSCLLGFLEMYNLNCPGNVKSCRQHKLYLRALSIVNVLGYLSCLLVFLEIYNFNCPATFNPAGNRNYITEHCQWSMCQDICLVFQDSQKYIISIVRQRLILPATQIISQSIVNVLGYLSCFLGFLEIYNLNGPGNV